MKEIIFLSVVVHSFFDKITSKHNPEILRLHYASLITRIISAKISVIVIKFLLIVSVLGHFSIVS